MLEGLRSYLGDIMSAIGNSRATVQSQGKLAMDALISNQVGLAETIKHIYSGKQHFLKSVAPLLIERISNLLVLLCDVSLKMFESIQAHLAKSIKVHQ